MEESKKIIDDFKNFLDDEFNAAKNYNPNKADWLEGTWTGYLQQLLMQEEERPL